MKLELNMAVNSIDEKLESKWLPSNIRAFLSRFPPTSLRGYGDRKFHCCHSNARRKGRNRSLPVCSVNFDLRVYRPISDAVLVAVSSKQVSLSLRMLNFSSIVCSKRQGYIKRSKNADIPVAVVRSSMSQETLCTRTP